MSDPCHMCRKRSCRSCRRKNDVIASCDPDVVGMVERLRTRMEYSGGVQRSFYFGGKKGK